MYNLHFEFSSRSFVQRSVADHHNSRDQLPRQYIDSAVVMLRFPITLPILTGQHDNYWIVIKLLEY
jgi:hypothetical protein